ncbi:MAG: c-type cytochrome [Rhodobacteraceae bacterium]|nr:c-type cytochrome [Paracoccaceae bacterium]
MRLIPALCTCLVLAAPMARADSLRDHALTLFSPLPDRIALLDGRPVTEAEVVLGRMLYFDPRLADDGATACADCHDPATGGDGNRPTSTGHAWQSGPQNAPTLFNAMLNRARFWQGWDEDLPAAPARDLFRAERIATPDRMVAVLASMPGYVAAFEAAFPGEADPIRPETAARALAAYASTLLTPAPFDDWLRGEDAALSEAAREGLALFIDRGCAGCHQGVNLGGDSYHPVRVARVPGTESLPESGACFALEEADGAQYLYRAGTLRNVTLTAPYFSEGTVWSLPLAVEIMGRAQLGADLTEAEADAITAFLATLEGRPPPLMLPMLPAETGLTPRPQVQ